MRRSKILTTSAELNSEFERCCNTYSGLSIAVAWCGNPDKTLPFELLKSFSGSLQITVGVSFEHTHPDAIQYFMDVGSNVRIFREGIRLFHPKVYFFRSDERFAVILGSSNLTYGGFYENFESNCLIEGIMKTKRDTDVLLLQTKLADWRKPKYSFVPDGWWLRGYRTRYNNRLDKQRKQKLEAPQTIEDAGTTADWLRHADWPVYLSKVKMGLSKNNRSGKEYLDVLDAAKSELKVPWRPIYFNDIEKRRIIGGINPYGWLGHVSASGKFRSLLANGKLSQKRTIVEMVNAIARYEAPIRWTALESRLDELVSLGPTMSVWGRLLCLVRPDLYCTVASPSVRRNLSNTLDVPQNSFDTPKGYIQLIRLLHSSPWFHSSKPANKAQEAIWERKVAFMDAIFY